MAEIVNLHRVKQRQARAAAAAAAQRNRVRHGRTAVKANDQRTEARREAAMDALKRGDAPRKLPGEPRE